MGLFGNLSVRHKKKDEFDRTNIFVPPRRDPIPRRRGTVAEPASTDRVVRPKRHAPSDLPPPPEESVKSTTSTDRTKIIIGLDYGTTFSGAAYAIQHPDDVRDKTNISIVRNWPVKLAGDTASSKVPSIISYETNGKTRWGFDALHSDKGDKFRWMKLLLEPELNLKPSEEIDLQEIKALLRTHKKKAVQVAADYLKCLWEHVVSQICEDYGRTTFDFAKKSIVLTVPAVWTPAARHNTFLVATGAGLVSDDYDLQIISEPEAAAAAILKDRANDVKPDDCYIVCDAGGGTVDLSSYWIKSTKPLCFSERVVSDGDTCGAVVLDTNFKRLLRTTLKGDTFDKLPPQNVTRIMNDFEAGIRKTFDGTDSRTYTVSLPGVPDDPETGPQAGIMTLSPTILHPVFDPIMNKVERLVRKQINSLQKKGHIPKALFLVGGFGENHYMKLRLKERFETRRNAPEGQEGIEVLSPNFGGWESIANGAVQCELLGIKNLISVRIARYNFGIACNQPFDPSRHRLEDKYICSYRHVERANNQVNWCLRRGDEIKPGREVRFRFNDVILPRDIDPSTNAVRIQAKIVRSEDDDAPSHNTTAVQHFVSITISWSRAELEKGPLLRNKGGTQFWYPRYDIIMVAGPAKLDFWTEIEGVKRGEVCGVKFNESFGDDSLVGMADVERPEGLIELA